MAAFRVLTRKGLPIMQAKAVMAGAVDEASESDDNDDEASESDDNDDEASESDNNDDEHDGPTATIPPEERDDLDQVLATLIRLQGEATKSRSVVALRRAWRQLIWKFCKASPPASFPRWILRTTSELFVLSCLNAEFQPEGVAAMWRDRHRVVRVTAAFTSYLDLKYTETLALWFSAGQKSPGPNTFKSLWSRVKTEGADAFTEHIYPTILKNWADRCGYDLDTRSGRSCAIFARGPVPTDSTPSKSLRLMPRDIQFLAHGGQGDSAEGDEEVGDAGSEEANGEFHESMDEHESEILGERGMNSEGGELGGGADGHELGDELVGNLAADNDDEQSVRQDDTGADIMEQGRHGSPNHRDYAVTPLGQGSPNIEFGDSTASSPLQSRRVRSIDLSPLMLEPVTPGVKRAASLDVQAPDNRKRGRQSAPSLPPGAMPGMDVNFDRSLGSVELHDNTTGFMMDSPLVERRSDGSSRSPKAAECMTTGPAVQTSPDAGPTNAACPSLPWFRDLGSRDIQILESDTGWLNDTLMDSFAQLFAFSSESFAHITNLKLDNKPTADDTAVQRFRRNSPRLPEPDTAILCINMYNSHWVCVSVGLIDNRCRLFDSLPSAEHLTTTTNKLANLQPLLTQSANTIVVTTAECPTQSDGYNCGVYALVCACFSVIKMEIPKTINAPLWRKLFLAMAKRTSMSSCLPEHVVSVVRTVTRPPPIPLNENGDLDGDHPHEAVRELSPLAQIDWHAREAERHATRASCLARACVEQYTHRLETTRDLLAWVTTEAQPAIIPLANSAADQVERLGELLQQVQADETIYRGLVGTIDAATAHAQVFAGIDLEAAAQNHLEAIIKAKQYQTLRLDNSRLAVEACSVLELDNLASTVRDTISGYENLIRRIKNGRVSGRARLDGEESVEAPDIPTRG